MARQRGGPEDEAPTPAERDNAFQENTVTSNRAATSGDSLAVSGPRPRNGPWKTAAMIAFILAVGSADAGVAASPRDAITRVASPAAAPSNVCVTQYGTCPVTPGTTRGAPCRCFMPPATWVPGVAEYWVNVPTDVP